MATAYREKCLQYGCIHSSMRFDSWGGYRSARGRNRIACRRRGSPLLRLSRVQGSLVHLPASAPCPGAAAAYHDFARTARPMHSVAFLSHGCRTRRAQALQPYADPGPSKRAHSTVALLLRLDCPGPHGPLNLVVQPISEPLTSTEEAPCGLSTAWISLRSCLRVGADRLPADRHLPCVVLCCPGALALTAHLLCRGPRRSLDGSCVSESTTAVWVVKEPAR